MERIFLLFKEMILKLNRARRRNKKVNSSLHQNHVTCGFNRSIKEEEKDDQEI